MPALTISRASEAYVQALIDREGLARRLGERLFRCFQLYLCGAASTPSPTTTSAPTGWSSSCLRGEVLIHPRVNS